MAAGRRGGYLDTEFKGSFAHPTKDEYDRIRNGNLRTGNRDATLGGRGRVSQRGMGQRELANGSGYRSSSSGSDSGGSGGIKGASRNRSYLAQVSDREPGELSSEDGSDDNAGQSESQGRDSEVSKMGNGSSITNKRKFSTFSPLLSLSKSQPQSPNPNDENMFSLKKSTYQEKHKPVLNVASLASESQSDMHVSPSEGQDSKNQEDVERLEDEDYIPTRHISASRWAGDASSTADEGEISDDQDIHTRRKSQFSEFLAARIDKRLSSPEPIEGLRDGSNVVKGRSFDSGSIMSSSGDHCRQNTLDGEDHMEEDKNSDTDISLSPAGTDSEDGDYSSGTPEPPAVPKRTVNMLHGCRSVDEFERLNKINEGTYGVVYRARDRKTGEIVALKKVKMEKEREGFPLTSVREINILLSLHHSSIVDVKEVVVGSNLDSIFMVMEYMEHDLKGLVEAMKQPFSQSEVKCLMLQLLEGIDYLHHNWVLHRDLKTSNLLMNNQGELKICDFGLARQYGSPLKPYTHLVVTLWYRAPELLLGVKEYSTSIDMWSLGCIMAELLSREPLFNGKSEFDQVDKIFRILGTPNETIWPGFSKLPGVKVNFVKHRYNQLRKKFPVTSFAGSPVLSDSGFDLLNRLLTFDPKKRITADAALKHDWFREVPLPKSKEFMPTFPSRHAQDRQTRRVLKSPDPLQELHRKEQLAELGTGGLFG